jgi:hypothetical protein
MGSLSDIFDLCNYLLEITFFSTCEGNSFSSFILWLQPLCFGFRFVFIYYVLCHLQYDVFPVFAFPYGVLIFKSGCIFVLEVTIVTKII